MNKKIYLFTGVISFCVIGIFIAAFLLNIDNVKSELSELIVKEWREISEPNEPEYLLQLDKLVLFEMKDFEKEGDTYEVRLSVTAPDVGIQLSSLDHSEFPVEGSEEELNEFLCEQIQKSKIETKEVVIYVLEKDNKREVYFTEEFIDLMSGKLYSFAEEKLLNSLQNK